MFRSSLRSFSVRGAGALSSAALATVVLGLAATPLALADKAEPAGGATIGAWGFDLAGRDATVKPGDDFFRYSGGNWLRSNTLPSDRTRWGTFDQLQDKAEADVRAIIEELGKRRGAPGSVEQKIGDYYAAWLDTAALDRLGLGPAQPGLRDIAAARTHTDVARLMARYDMPLPGPIGFGITLDQKNPDRYIIVVTHGGLGLPEREFYLREDAQFREIQANYRAHIVRLLGLAGRSDGAAMAERIFALETEIARRHWPVAKRRERELTYNLKKVSELSEISADFPWKESLAAGGVTRASEVVVRELDAMAPLATLFRQTPVAVWRDYLTYHYLRTNSALLPTAFDREVFEFFGKSLNGQPEQRPRWQRAVDATNGALGEAIGQIYVARHFPPESKAQMLDLVENVRRAYATRIRNLAWMTEPTRQVALEKLAAFRPKIGYPDRWRDYSSLEVRAGDAFGNALRSRVFEARRQIDRLDKPTDRDEWFMTPQTVNAYYNPVFNEIVFPAAILQPPFFDPKADPAVNYGAIGGVIGHEMGHGFDDQGAKSDARGVLRTWWNAQDEAAFRQLGDRLAEQYSQFEVLPGLRINGRLSLGENIGDLGGLSVSLEAYRLSLGGKPAPVLEGLTGEQRFFHGWAQVWRTLWREQRLRNQVLTGPHSPAEFRVNGVVRNMDAWYEAFGVRPGDRLYLPPEQRVRIW